MKTLLIAGIAVLAACGLQAQDAKAIYDKDCAKCHGADGKGDTKMGKKLEIKDLTDAKVQSAKDEEFAKAIKEGVKEKDSDKTRMKAFSDLSDDDVKALVAFVRGLKK